MSAEGAIFVEVRSGTGRSRALKAPPRNLVVLGDFGGQTLSAADAVRARRVAPGGIDAALAAVRPSVALAIDEPLRIHETLTFESLDDFHPDGLLARCSAFRTLLEQEASDRGSRGSGAPSEAPDGTSTGDAFESLLRREGRSTSRERRIVDELIRAAFDDAPRAGTGSQKEAAGGFGRIATDAMRAVLATPRLKALEAAWRGLDWLVSELDADLVRVDFVDVSREALAVMLEGPPEALDRSAVNRVFAASSDEHPLLVVGLFTFGRHIEDLLLLAKLGALVSRTGGLFVSHGELALCGCDSAADADDPRAWTVPQDTASTLYAELRSHPAARSVLLACPRFLLRQPYGPRSNPVDAFEFTELPTGAGAERFCWGNPALVAAAVLASGGERPVVSGLPIASYDDGTGGTALQLPVEVALGDRAAAYARASGLSVLQCNRATGDVVVDVHTLALDGAAAS